MIRINLLPGEKKRVRGPAFGGLGALSVGRPGMWWGITAAAVIGWLGCLGVIYYVTNGRLDDLRTENQQLETRLEDLKAKTAGLAEVERKLERSYQLEEIVEKLERARTGPTRALMELSRVLSSGGGPTIDPEALERLRKEDPLAGYDDTWDVRKVWVRSFEETGGICAIQGTGKTGEDVAEFSRRLDLSELFTNVRLLRTKSEKDKDTGLEMTKFELSCKVQY